jgi:recombinational DNA repair protein RecT
MPPKFTEQNYAGSYTRRKMMQNQNEKEFFSQVGTGRAGVETMLAVYGPEIRDVAAPNVKGDFGTWTQRALVDISTNENLRGVIASKTGIMSIYSGLAKAATMGLQIGGQFPHAYFVPKGGVAVLMASADGYIFATTYGPGAIFTVDPQLHEVYEKDHVVINEKEGIWEHTYPENNPFVDRGKLLGFFTVLEFKDGRRAIPYIRIDEVIAIENAYGNKSSPMYTKSLIDAHRKTAMKKMLKPYMKLCEGLAMLMQLDDDAELPTAIESEPSKPLRDVTDRTASRLDKAAASMTPHDEPETNPEPEADEDGIPAAAQKVDANGQQDIF